ncbi:hypothetical protein Tco_0202606, partial [Tanacetum coccineum]
AARSFAAPRSSRSHVGTFFLYFFLSFFLSFFLILLAATFFPFDHQVINLTAFLLVIFLSFSVFLLLSSFPKEFLLSFCCILLVTHSDQKLLLSSFLFATIRPTAVASFFYLT